MKSSPKVLVVGGGPAGLTLARLLALKGWPVVVVDPLVPRRRRLELVGPAVVDAFRCAGIDDLLKDGQVARECLGICRQWGGEEVWTREAFLTHRGGTGYVVDREALDGALRRRGVDAGVVLAPARLMGLDRTPTGFSARVRTGSGIEEVATELIIDATGRRAVAGRRLGARLIRRHLHLAYPCEAVSPPPDRRAWLNIRGEEADWTYQLEGPGGFPEAWRVGCREPGGREGVDASTSYLRPPAGHGWIAVGDAASAFNPIWSEGLSNALGTAITVAGALLMEGSITDRIRDVYRAAVDQGTREL